MTDYIRVQWRATGHESSIPARRFDEAKHRRLAKLATDRNGSPLPPKYRTNLAGESRPRREPESPTAAPSAVTSWPWLSSTVPVPVAEVAPEETGHEADHEGES